MKVAVMQPYIFPYIGYFQLINEVDAFVFFDDVNFIKKGFINRNNILCNGESFQFSIPCKKISQNKRINQTEVDLTKKDISKLLLSIKQNYIKSPFFEEVYPLLEDFFSFYDKKLISQMAADSIILISKYLNLETSYKFSSEEHQNSIDLKSKDRIIAICKKEKANQYINPIGGVDLYSKKEFKKNNIDLKFIKSNAIKYKQFSDDFVPWLSIIDVIMFNSKNDIKQFLNNYKLV